MEKSSGQVYPKTGTFRPMRELPPLRPFAFMQFAKRTECAPGYFLAGSTMVRPTREEAGWTDADFDLTSVCDTYGDPRILDHLRGRYGVPTDEIALTCGSSQANALIYQMLLQPGDEVLAESPGYEVFHLLAQLSGAKTVFLPRREANGFLPDPAEFKKLLTPRTRLAVLTDMHNPTGAKMSAGLLKELIAAAAANGTWVLVDEIYLDHLLPGTHDETCYHYGDNVLITSSLTKVYGLGILRSGWCFAPRQITERIIDLIDLQNVEVPPISYNLIARVMMNQKRLRPRARMRHDRGLPVVREWARKRGDVTIFEPAGGITVAAKIAWLADRPGADSFALVEHLAKHARVQVSPGGAFQMPDWLRINIANDVAWLNEALAALGRGIDSFKAGKR
jgi:aspartate/methionine/tyrosine aminotransferase